MRDDDDEGRRWYYDAAAFDTVYAIGDTHGDVESAIVLFRDVLQAVRFDAATRQWAWVLPPRSAVVVCGDVVDRSRALRRPTQGENAQQDQLPDDLFLLRLFNHWDALAMETGSRVFRLVGNHEVFPETIQHSTGNDERLLYERVEKHPACGRDLTCNRVLSFTTPGSAYYEAIWNDNRARVVLQIGGWLFVHGGLTDRAVEYARTRSVAGIPEVVREFVVGLREEVPGGVRDLLQSRALDHVNASAGSEARRLLNLWGAATGKPAPACLVVGHSLQLAADLVLHRNHVMVHRHLTTRGGAPQQRYEDLDAPTGRSDRPAINASVDGRGRVSIFRVDVGLSRCWSSVFPDFEVWPQALCIRGAGASTLMARSALSAAASSEN